MGIADIRRENLRQLIKTEFKTRAEFAEKINKSPSQVAMWFMSSKGKRAIGEKVAREIEKCLELNQGELDLETGVLDKDHSTPTDLNNLISVATPTYLKELERLQQANDQGVLDEADKQLIKIIADKYKGRLK